MYRTSILCGVLLLLGCNSSKDDEAETPQVFAVLKVSRRQPTILNDDPMRAASLDEFNIYKRTQQQLVTSEFVILAALRMDGISQLPIIERQRDRKVRWLSENVHVDFPSDTEIMRVGMSGENVDEMVQIVNAIVKAYLQEVVDAERAIRLRRRDELNKSLSKYSEVMYRKLVVIQGIERALRDEINKSADSEEGVNEIVNSPELENNNRELADLEKFMGRMRQELYELDVNLNAPPRVFKLQDASQDATQ